MRLPDPIRHDIVLVGGGHAHALVLKMWAMAPEPGVRVTLVNPGPVAAYSGMLPGFLAGHYPRAALEIDLVRLCRAAGARLVLARATGIDRGKRRLQVEGQADIAYDLLSLDIGVTSDLPDLPGFAEHGVPAKPLDRLADRWEGFVTAVAAGAQAPEVVVAGAGLAGVEIALAARYRLGPQARVTLVERAAPLGALGRGARAALLAHLARAGVELRVGVALASVGPGEVRLSDGQVLRSQFTIGAAGARPQGWLAGTGLALEAGFVRVGPTLQTEGDARIFAAGDIAHLAHDPRPKAGVFAVREAPVLAHNLRAALRSGAALRPYRPQRDYLKLVATGGRGAVADKWGLRLDGTALWRWKDRIDRRFMAQFSDLPVMGAGPVAAGGAEERPLCGGCGAKAGRGALTAALGRLTPPRRSDVVKGAGDDAAVLAFGAEQQVLTTDHLRAFTLDPYVMARIAAVHALGDVWSMGARPQAALAQVILPPMGEGQQAEMLREILAAAESVFGPEGADLVGGHTSLGAELTVGFTVTGLVDRAITHAGARPGDALLLTKPIGTGVIMAAEMAGRAPGRVVAGALAAMQRPQGPAARLLAPHARAMTDVTGFGLAGHLLTILESSGVAARLDLEAVPMLPGAVELAAAGEGSSLLPANLQAMGRMTLTPGPRADLLFDPQTGGGILAAVPADRAPELLAGLAALGETAALIGAVSEGAPHIWVA